MFVDFMFLDQFLFELSCKNKQENTHGRTQRITFAFCKNKTSNYRSYRNIDNDKYFHDITNIFYIFKYC